MSAALGASVPWRPPVVVCARRQSPRARTSRQGRQSFFFASDEKMGQRMARTIPGFANLRNHLYSFTTICRLARYCPARPAVGQVHAMYRPRMTSPRSRSRGPGSGLRSRPGPWVGLLVALLGMALALEACGPASQPGLPAAVVPAAASPTATAASVGRAPSATPIASSAALLFRAARSDIQLPSARSRAVAFVFGSAILLCGGLTSTGTTTGSILRIDLRSGRVSNEATLAVPVHDAGGAVMGGSGFVFGGGSVGPGSVVQRVGPTGASIAAGQLPAVRADLAAVSVAGELVVIGGGTPAGPDARVLATTDGRHFRIVAKLLVGVRYPAVAVVGGLVYVIGGSTQSGDTRVIQVVDPRTGVARIVGHLAHGLSHASALVVGGAVLIAGGRTGGRAQDALWQLDLASGTVTRIGRLPYPVSDAATAVAGGIGYLIGGEELGPVASIITVSIR